ncbi:MAG TPA: [Fe-S]-binding protein, partial [Coriobacteriia bacterium]
MPSRYRTTLEERDHPAHPDAADAEFTSTSSDAGASRRDFLRLAGFSMAGAMAACSRAPVRRAIPYVSQPDGVVPGRALWYATTCGGCAAGCGLLVKARDGRPIKIEGCPD